jgi:hypothetical protein
MSAKLTIFLSSTVKDFGPVRSDIAEWLRSRGLEVLESADPEFPVEPSMHSLDACLSAIQSCHVLILLVGGRYGNSHLYSKQSITWREHDEAKRLGIPIIKLILKSVNEAAELTSKLKKKKRRPIKFEGIDKRVFPFIDAIRKGEKDNWVHVDWDGSLKEAKRRIDARLNRLFVGYQGRHRKVVEAAERQIEYVAARKTIDSHLAFMQALRPIPGVTMKALAGEFLEILALNRAALFGFSEPDLYNFAIYVKEKNQLKVFAREAHEQIRKRNRPWKIGQGQVGLAAKGLITLVSPNLRHSGKWTAKYRSDATNYVSAIAVPIIRATEPTAVAGVFVVTSNKPDQFRISDQVEVLTAESIALMFGTIDIFNGLKA